MSDKTPSFVPVRGTEAKLDLMGFNDGYVYFAADTGKIYLDYIDADGAEVKRKLLGNGAGGGEGGNAGIYYASRVITDEEKLEDNIKFALSDLNIDDYPEVDGLIINLGDDNCFYRIIGLSREDRSVIGQRLSISSGGSGSDTPGSLAEDIALKLESLPTVNLINGYSQLLYFTATSAKDKKGEPKDDKITIMWTLEYTDDGGSNYSQYNSGSFQVDSGIRTSFEFGKLAKDSASSRLTLKASQTNDTSTITRSVEFRTSRLQLSESSSFSNISYFDPKKLTLQCNVDGDMDKIIEYYFDDEDVPFHTEALSESASRLQAVSVAQYVSADKMQNGAHKVWIRLFQSINGEKGIEVEPLIFEVGLYDGIDPMAPPIIWLGDYKEQYYNYDTIQIPFRVYDPQAENPIVHYKRNNIELSYSPQTITDSKSFAIFEIANPELDVINHYTITCGDGERETIRKIEIKVVKDPERTDFGVQRQGLLTYELNTVGSGRSNAETMSKRTTLVNNVAGADPCAAKFENFNWYNNGWTTDKDNKTCLRISNGAKLTIPIGRTTFANPNGQASTEQSHSIEIMFKIRNVQDYSNLIRTITRYKNDENLYKAFYDDTTGTFKTSYTNYDAFLAWYLKNNEIEFTDPKTGEKRRMEYDDLEFSHIAKQINLNNIVCGYYSGDTKSATGLCLGPQDAFFSNGTDTVNVSYVENNIVTLSVVCKYSKESVQNLLYIYLNGVLTGVTRNTKSDGFTVNNDSIIINSDHCDIDLYKIRVYRTDLNVNDIVMNYAADFENVNIYDQNKLAKENTAINEFQFNYENMIKYNNEHPDEPLMPYIIFDTTSIAGNDNKLPYSKKVKLNVGVEFVNTPLEMYYNKGRLEELAKADGLWSDGATAAEKQAAVEKYYQYHCPSFISDSAQMSVQGTSSEFYPRRNYKIKTKNKDAVDGQKRVNIFLNRGPFKDRYNADLLGTTQKEYILCSDRYVLKDKETNEPIYKYYEDDKGEIEVTFTEEKPYIANKYYIKNKAYVERGKEQTRQDYWYFNNYTCGTTKFTMKIDYMESSGTYNMGFANMVKNGYSKHPLDDYNNAKAFQVLDPNKTVETEATEYEEGIVYTYYNHKGNPKEASNEVFEDNLVITSKEDFDMGPYALYEKLMAENPTTYTKLKVAGSDNAKYNKWYIMEPGYSDFIVKDTDDYRTSVRGFRVLAFHKKSDPNGGDPIYQFIGIYNMLLDKGSDEVYGFALDKTTGKDPKAKFVGNGSTSMPKIAECWEFENNSRTFCSFRDPKNRKDLKFDVFNDDGTRVLNAVKSAPVVADSFEYRYHDDADILDYIMAPDGQCKDDPSLDFSADDITLNQENRAERLLKDYSNWEKAVAWVWSTCTDNVVSQGDYESIDIGEELFDASKHYIETTNPDYNPDDPNSSAIIYQPATEYVVGTKYYKKKTEKEFIIAYVGEYLYSAKKDELYTGSQGKNGMSYVACGASEAFNPDAKYYILKSYTDEELATKADRLVQLCTDSSFTEGKTYYTYDGDQPSGQAVKVITLTSETYEPNKYYEGITITYGKRSYNYDTKEYRGDKFTYELKDHFDEEYMATYFVMTEVFECYDSRGKNCMMASWGPQKAGGDYIWYPIFYDIDTQLGINNTGIPSFEYNVDATEDGNYSTSDSVLWNNFYKYFKTGLIIPKYRHLRGVNTSVFGSALVQPPLKTIDRIESYYLTDYNTTGNLADKGTRPLVAVNLDEYYKYITITNNASVEDGTTGHISSDTEGKYTVDANGTYFYALQGNRSLSRQQFLSNRLEYIDSWLNEGNYQRGGANRIRGRVAANNSIKTSDKWVETSTDPYYKNDKTFEKNHLFDAEYWMTLTPAHSSYVTLGDDNEAYPSQKYDGINPLRFNIDSIENGVRKSANYPEQLLYVYGINQMKDLGDMSNLYWQEFEITGDASKLTSLKLGYDGLDENGERWHNDNVNQFSIPASASSENGGMPLLKEVNMSNVQFNAAAGSAVLDLTSCEKLENFRATGSNFDSIKFAQGVALNTLYLPTSITNLELVEANLLKNVIVEDDYQYPIRDAEGNLHANPGLYLQGFFDNSKTGDLGDTVIASLNIAGGGLGYDSYKLLKQYFKIRQKQANPSQVSMTKVNWCPYVQMTVDDKYDPAITYYADNGHYGLETYTYTTARDWNIKVENGEIYYKNTEISDDQINQITDLAMFKEFIDSDRWIKNSSKEIPEISGIIYINNTEPIKESELRNTYQVAYPDLTIFCANVEQGYTARFVIMDEDEGNDGRYTLIGSMTLNEGESWFRDPIDMFGNVSDKKPNHDFYGWALTNSASADILINIDKSINKWNDQTLDPDVHTYIFYAICPIHKWTVKYLYKDGSLVEEAYVPHGEYASMSTIIPWKNDSDLPLEETYKFLGYNRSATSNIVMDLTTYQITEDTTFYAVFDSNPISVYDDIHPEYFAPSVDSASGATTGTFVDIEGRDSKWTVVGGVVLALTKKVKGKITVPAYFEVDGVEKPVIGVDATFSSPGNLSTQKYLTSGGKTYDDTVYATECYGSDLTHVFFEKYTDTDGNIKCNIRKFYDGAFSMSRKLVWVEYPEGLREIGDCCFQNFISFLDEGEDPSAAPSLINANIGGTIARIDTNAFANSFALSVDTIVIGPEVMQIDVHGIDVSSGYDSGGIITAGPKTIIIGSAEAKSKLGTGKGTLVANAIRGYRPSSARQIECVDWYTDISPADGAKVFTQITVPINYL